ncbi:hypothetical protein ACFWAY_44240 [Rhodococcus sp. NPDC059968]|uniref:hypothetical protein n=1 Tax=Rhodococcus sp. NPDC059968 TaxID=3347017 RepID=UPI0036710277
MGYTLPSRVRFLADVADTLEKQVVSRASAGPWALSNVVKDAIQRAPPDDGTERHMCGLIDPNDARAAVARDPDTLRAVADAMKAAAADPSAAWAVFDAMFAVALRYDRAMILGLSSNLQTEIDPPDFTEAPQTNIESTALEPLAEPEVVETIDVDNRPAVASAPAPAATARDSSAPAAATIAATPAAVDVVDPGDSPWE